MANVILGLSFMVLLPFVEIVIGLSSSSLPPLLTRPKKFAPPPRHTPIFPVKKLFPLPRFLTDASIGYFVGVGWAIFMKVGYGQMAERKGG